MNKNTIIGLVIIIASVQFFTSRFYYEKILHKEYVYNKKNSNKDTTSVINNKEGKVNNKQTNNNVKISNKIQKMSENIDSTSFAFNVDSGVINRNIKIETDDIICEISEKGALIKSLKIRKYSLNNSYIEIIDDSVKGAANLKIASVSYDKTFFKADSLIKNNEKVKNDSLVVVLKTLDNSIAKIFTFYKKGYVFNIDVISDNMIGKKVSFAWNGGIKNSQNFKGRSAIYAIKSIHYGEGENKYHEACTKTKDIKVEDGNINWIAIAEKYFSVAIVNKNKSDLFAEFHSKSIKDSSNKNILLSMKYNGVLSDNNLKFKIYTGPKKVSILKNVYSDLPSIVFGVSTKTGKFFAKIFIGGEKWFPKLCNFVLNLLNFFQGIVKDYGVVIIILTIILKIVTYPLTRSSMNSMNKMKEIQPKINKIKEKYKKNPQIMNQKIMEFYREEGVNPMAGAGGCLPMFLQMPIMISLYVVLRKSIELRGHGTFLLPWIHDLSAPEVIFHLPFSLPIYGSNFAILPLIFALFMYFQNKETMKDPNQKAMVYLMPLIMLMMFNSFPSGLNLYFTFSTLLQFIQQKYLVGNK